MIYAVLLNPSVDHILKVDNFKAGETLRVKHTEQLPLGKGLNVACAISALNEKAKVIGLMGRDDAPFYNRFAAEHNIECEWVLIDSRVRNNITIIDREKNNVTHLREPGFRASRNSVEEVLKRLVRQIKPKDWVAFCGSLPQGTGARTYREMITACKEKRANSMLDTSGRALVEGIRGMPYGIKPNLVEFEEIFSEQVNGIQHIALKAKSLLDRGIRNVFVSLGEDGLLSAHSKSACRIMVRVPQPVNTVGCGDAMLAGLLTGLSRGESFEKVCSLGVACGAANTVGLGPGLIRRADVQRFLSRIEKVSI